MKNSINKIAVIALIFLIFNVESTCIKAEDRWVVMKDVNNENYILDYNTGEKTFAAYCFDKNGNMIKKDLNEYAKELNIGSKIEVVDNNTIETNNDLPNISSKAVTQSTTYYYNRTRVTNIKGTPVRVSTDYKTGDAPGTINVGYTKTISDSYSIPASLTFSLMQDKIKAQAGFTWVHNVSTATSLSASLPIPANKTSYLQFTPYLKRTEGTGYYVIRYSNGNTTTSSKYNVSGTSPIKLPNGSADGIYEVKSR